MSVTKPFRVLSARFRILHLLTPMLAVVLLVAAMWPSLACAQGLTPSQGLEEVVITPTGQIQKFQLAMGQPLGGDPAMASQLQELLRQNLDILPILDIIPENAILGGSAMASFTSQGIDFNRFSMAGAGYLLTTGWTTPNTVELRVYTVSNQSLLVGKQYASLNPSLLTDVADKFSAALLEAFGLQGDLYRASLAYVSTGENRNVFAARPMGRERRQITSLQGTCMSPAWSPNSQSIAFTHLSQRFNTLGIWSGGTVRKVKFPGNLVIGPSYLPNSQLAASVAVNGIPGIYLLEGNSLQPGRALVADSAINTSPRFDASGTRMVFVSDRFGNPHIMLKIGGDVRRLTTSGWNTDPTISPDGQTVVFTRQTGGGHRLFRIDLGTGAETQITFGPGSDEQPAFLSDSYFLAFTSSQAGGKQLFLTTKDGLAPKPLPLGSATFPAWSVTEAP